MKSKNMQNAVTFLYIQQAQWLINHLYFQIAKNNVFFKLNFHSLYISYILTSYSGEHPDKYILNIQFHSYKQVY